MWQYVLQGCIYQSNNGKDEKVFDGLEWLVPAGCSHIPNKGESRKDTGSDITAITVTSPEEGGTRKTRMG